MNADKSFSCGNLIEIHNSFGKFCTVSLPPYDDETLKRLYLFGVYTTNIAMRIIWR